MLNHPAPIAAPACLLCHQDMVWRDVSPCMECGGDPRELRMLENQAHSYNALLVFGAFPLVLCDFCQVDFGTYPSYFFGLPRHRHLGFNDLEYQEKVAPTLGQDWVCNDCGYRLAFLNFVAEVRGHLPIANQLDH